LNTNRASYDRIAARWQCARNSFYGNEQAYLDLLLAQLMPGSTVLDLGCGTGAPMARYVVSKGHRVIGVDQSEAMLDLARTALPDGEWVLSPIEGYPYDKPYDCAMLWDSLFHICRDRHAPILQRVVDRLPKGGRLMLTVGGSEHPAFTDTMFDEPFFYDSNTPQETESILGGLGMEIILGEFMNVPTTGRDKGRYAIVAEKRPESDRTGKQHQ
jgi:SAM-dependent methyltransferase